MYVGQITAAKCRLDLFNTAPVIVTGQLSINELPPPPSVCLQGGIVNFLLLLLSAFKAV